MADSTPNTLSDRRPQQVAAFGFALQLVFYGALVAISFWADSDAIAAASRFVLVGLPIWLILSLLFTQIRRVHTEALETAELKRAQQEGVSDAIFAFDDEALLLERNRLASTVRWLLPATTVFLAILLIGGHFVGWGPPIESLRKPVGFDRTQRPELMMWFVVGVGFLSFLYARYALALARLPDWRLLRAGATCMAGTAMACLGLVITLMVGGTVEWAEPLFASIMRIALVILGIEFSANFLLDFYRPRTDDEIPRPSFDSRLLGLISEPGSVARSIADTLNYQFGFEVSSTWFYQLLQRWLFPIVVFTIVAVLCLTSLVIVDADEQVVIERLGRLVATPTKTLGPGFHCKWPFPVDIAYRAPVARINELVVGEASESEQEHSNSPILWTKAHEYVPEMMLPVASPALARLSAGSGGSNEPTAESESVPVSLLMVSVPIEYRIKDIQKYLYTYEDPVKLMECVAYRILSDFGASVDIDELMGPGRRAFNKKLKKLIQTRLDQFDAGIEIVFAGIAEAHPPPRNNVAATFQAVVSAQTRMGATINGAEGEARKTLTACAGAVARAHQLDQAIRAQGRLQGRNANADPQRNEAQQRVETLLLGDRAQDIAPLSGAAAAQIAGARARASELINQAASKARAFGAEVAAYEAAPRLYKRRKQLDVYEGLQDIRKYLVVGDPSNVIIIYQTMKQGGLDRVLSKGLKEK